ncbi:hypothetical protein EU95_0714 [Prochlorococcus marinus str. MIT 9201]|uniref:Uncharacterized protein n=1 Tax=Prochlorococcus marinus str. MIT 9201 TaxID=93057 RepID=A0A0A2A754_PROMR|nr:hypothetical protein EU95_0714 [Prochlorococcus marinus str. MIT 9201]
MFHKIFDYVLLKDISLIIENFIWYQSLKLENRNLLNSNIK